MTAEDMTSRTEATARDTANLLGASEHIGGGVDDQGPNPLLAKALGPDPWKPWCCQRCGEITRVQPEVCECGYRNYGEAS